MGVWCRIYSRVWKSDGLSITYFSRYCFDSKEWAKRYEGIQKDIPCIPLSFFQYNIFTYCCASIIGSSILVFFSPFLFSVSVLPISKSCQTLYRLTYPWVAPRNLSKVYSFLSFNHLLLFLSACTWFKISLNTIKSDIQHDKDNQICIGWRGCVRTNFFDTYNKIYAKYNLIRTQLKCISLW